LSELHEKIWTRLKPISTKASPFYAPENWMPHISLAYADLTPENLPCVMPKLAFRNLHWQIQIDNLTFIHEPDGEIGEKRFEFKFGEARNR